VQEVLPRKDYLRLLTEVGFHLKVLGRFDEARGVISKAMEGYDYDKNYRDAAVNSESLAETFLLEGKMREALAAVGAGRNGIQYAELSGDPFRQMPTLLLKGQILHYSGDYDGALAALFVAEEGRRAHSPLRQPIRSLYLLDLLGELDRHEELLEIANRFRPLLDENTATPFTGVFHLFVGQALALRAIGGEDRSLAGEALKLLDTAKCLIDKSKLPHLQPRVPCIRARLLTFLGEFEQAEADLNWALAISEHSRMRVFEIDCHFGFCDLYLSRGEPIVAKRHFDMARDKMAEGSYSRPRHWMEELSARLSSNS
jgi:tetratricopeptide (TPR) repeat protein